MSKPKFCTSCRYVYNHRPNWNLPGQLCCSHAGVRPEEVLDLVDGSTSRKHISCEIARIGNGGRSGHKRDGLPITFCGEDGLFWEQAK